MTPLPTPSNNERLLRVVGLDPSLRNWGIAIGDYDLVTGKISILHLDLINPVLATGKQTRQNSHDLESAYQLFEGSMAVVRHAEAVFVEVPVGSQSARAMASYGVCVGVLGSLRAAGIPFFELTPTEVKLAGAGDKKASKDAMIAWATNKYPDANWPMYSSNGERLVSEAKAEHMADAIAAIHAGTQCNPFQQMLPLLKRHRNYQKDDHADHHHAS